MNTDREDLIEIYQQFSDEELLKLFTSGNLTDLAKSVALKEIKTRRLPVPSLDLKSNDNLLVNMRSIAFNLSSSEADELGEIIKNNGIPFLIDKDNDTETLKNTQFYQLNVPSMHVAAAMEVINEHLNYSFDVDPSLLKNDNLNTGISDDAVNYNDEITNSSSVNDKSVSAESERASSNSRVQLFKLFVVMLFILIDWISLKLFDFSILHFFHVYK